MKPEDQFLKKMQPLSSRNQLLLDDNDRFGGYNATTIGFLLVGDTDITIVWILAEQQPVGRWVELKQEPVSPSSD